MAYPWNKDGQIRDLSPLKYHSFHDDNVVTHLETPVGYGKHTLWEMTQWMDKYVKNAPKRDAK